MSCRIRGCDTLSLPRVLHMTRVRQAKFGRDNPRCPATSTSWTGQMRQPTVWLRQLTFFSLSAKFSSNVLTSTTEQLQQRQHPTYTIKDLSSSRKPRMYSHAK
ncbi:hypothetical protein CROQUDRAFT_88965 [Cronartium quercuum f. sp. fusiforme G11]|uniref:Uncharacterized protein n=1 Tax=Cronartium quercuum f. sp. fusiforme G11 TaxID=708437 RepID=A0A9P6NM37_9BASI|nr:hypothetical protein CROQUDRAFT_88965 [Cronartium quercuum f. sp. fusiforme G11]